MHPFMFVGGVLHATLLLVVAFFIWFAAASAHGWLRLFGRMLGFWLVILAVASILFGLFGIGHHHMRGWMAPGAASAASNSADNSTPY